MRVFTPILLVASACLAGCSRAEILPPLPDRPALETALRAAESKLAQFREVDAPRRLAEAELGVREAHNLFEDAEDEMRQLEEMYRENEVAEKTRDIVLKRGHNKVEQLKQRLALKQLELKALRDFELPRERDALEQGVATCHASLGR